MKRIGLFGGSFDPIHNGHLAAVNSFLDSGLVDEVWILLTPDPPHKTDRQLTKYEHRYEMLNLVFRNWDRVKISEVESKLPKPSYTLQSILYLKNEHPETLFYFCLGEDSLESFHKWHKYWDILNETALLVVERPGSDHKDVDPEILEKTIFLDHQSVDVSSTGIREEMKFVLENNLPMEVQNYIQKHQLYTENK